LVLDKKRNLYGVTWFGGGKGNSCNAFYGGNCGTAFKLTPPKKKGGAWKEKVLYSFPGGTQGQPNGDGGQPNGALVFDSKGALYGTTTYGGNEAGDCRGGAGSFGCGTLFKIKPPSTKGGAWIEEVLHRFDIKDGVSPNGGLVIDGAGNVYGTTLHGPQSEFGLVFQLRPPSGKSLAWTEKVLYLFSNRNDSGEYPAAGVIRDTNGNLYGTATSSGGIGAGAVFRLSPPKKKGGTWTIEGTYDFGAPPDGEFPAASLTAYQAGNLYSTTELGGTGQSCQGGCGTVFRVSP